MAASGARSSRLGVLGEWWGVLAGALLIAAWINEAAGPVVIVALSALVLLWNSRTRRRKISILSFCQRAAVRGSRGAFWLPGGTRLPALTVKALATTS
jgi:hypothetical protein